MLMKRRKLLVRLLTVNHLLMLLTRLAQHDSCIACTTSSAEEIQKKLSQSKSCKAFNTVFAQRQMFRQVDGQQLLCLLLAMIRKLNKQLPN
jgi:predicted dinucleotide-binding enzyme